MGKTIAQHLILVFAALLVTPMSFADIDATFRQQNAVVLYDFNETTNDIIDTADPKFGAPLNLKIYYPSSVIRQAGSIQLNEPNLIRSLTVADKITNACKAGTGITVEVLLENNESVEKRAGFDRANNGRPHPLRIVSLAKDLFSRNFVLGQFYDGGNQYMAGVNTSRNEDDANNLGNSLRDPIVSKISSILLPNENDPTPTMKQQKVILSVNTSGVGKLYLSDANGNLYLDKIQTTGLGGDFSKWRTGSYLTLGNNYFPDASVASTFALPTNFAALYPNDRNSRSNPNRYWKGKLHLVAIYCQELTAEQVFGAALQTIKYTSHPIPTNLAITPSLMKAHKIYQRVSGSNTPISNPVLQSMATKLDANDPVGAAAYVTDLSEFYNNILKDFASKMSNREETINVPLNDFTATIIGGVRDNLNFQTLLWDDITYQADPAQAAVPSDLINDILTSNNHYEALSTQHFDLKKVLVKNTQKLYDGTKSVQNPSPAGLLTSRQWMAAHAIAGTNRRLVEYSLKQFLCTPIENAADATGPDNVVGQDIDRFPGGSHSKYTSSCRACHTVMDGFRPAFARFTFSNNFAKHAFLVPSLAPNSDMEDASAGMEQKPAGVAYKNNKNDTVFAGGMEVKNDNWVNNANLGTNATRFGWSRTSGKGPQDFGRAIAESKRFPSCMAERVFSTICKRAPGEADKTLIQAAATGFSTDHGFNLKYLFQKIGSAPECLGE